MCMTEMGERDLKIVFAVIVCAFICVVVLALIFY